ncbi:MAG: lysophospholipid acyltransferase family protein [Gemmatimonadales bacterium]
MRRFLLLLAGQLLRLLARTWHLEIIGDDTVERLRRSGIPLVFAVWHGHMLAPLWHRRGEGITLLVSRHRDGGYLAQAAEGWGFSVVRGSSTRGGVGGLLGLVKVLSAGGEVALTPDGPRGPARVAKGGALVAARSSRAAVVPVGAGASAWWRFRSWDRFGVPQPFARVRVVYGEPITQPSGIHSPDGATSELQGSLNRVQRIAEC